MTAQRTISADNPRISVCIPVYNGERYLAETIESILAQTFQDFELIIVDDCSNDGSMEIAERYMAADSRIRLFRNARNRGLVGNWNKAASLARGDWIKFLFQDDCLSANCLERFLAAVGEEDHIAFCRRTLVFDDATGSETRAYYREHEQLLDRCFALGERVDPAEICAFALTNAEENIFGEPSAMLVRREAFFRFGPCNEDLLMLCDVEFALRVASNTGVRFLPEYLATFRVHGGSSSAQTVAGKRFRYRYVDNIVWLHEMRYAPSYANLRRVGASLSPPVRVEERLELKILYAEEFIGRLPGDQAAALRAELGRLSERYPGISITPDRRIKWRLKRVYWMLRGR